MAENNLYWQSGVSEQSIADFLAACIEACFPAAKNHKETMLSWWEPHPDSALDEKDMKKLRKFLHPLLRPGQPDFASGLSAAECRIFFPDGGLHLVDDGEGVRWFAFSQAEKKDWQKIESLQIIEKKAVLKNKQAFAAFNLGDVSGCCTGDLKLKEFTAPEGLIAWTLMLEKEEG